jgi:hypothetical protein
MMNLFTTILTILITLSIIIGIIMIPFWVGIPTQNLMKNLYPSESEKLSLQEIDSVRKFAFIWIGGLFSIILYSISICVIIFSSLLIIYGISMLYSIVFNTINNI